MQTFVDYKLRKQLKTVLAELDLETPTPIQEAAFSPIKAGKDFVGIAQTGTGKTFAYLLPILEDLKYSDQPNPRVLILAPTRELVIQIVEQIEKLTEYLSVRVVGVYGGSSNIKGQRNAVAEGIDIIVGTPRRLYDLALTHVLRLNSIKKMVIDEVDIMLDFGYKTQLNNIFNYLPEKRQNILFSATMTTYVEELMDEFLVNPVKKTMAVSGTPLENISQSTYGVHNFYTKANLLNELLQDSERFSKVLVFVKSRVHADLLMEVLKFKSETSMIHAGKEQNFRTNSIDKFTDGTSRILVSTDVIARGIDIDDISTVINFDTPHYPENYIHRIGRTGRAERKGEAILFYTEKEEPLKADIEKLMDYSIPEIDFPEEVEIAQRKTAEEKSRPVNMKEVALKRKKVEKGASFHEKSEKNSKTNKERKSYKQQLKERYKKPLRRGDKIQNKKKKRK